jgi:hypothetical protein
MASPAAYEAAFKAAGFTRIVLANRNAVVPEQARRELDFSAAISTSRPSPSLAARSSITISRRGALMIRVLDSGEHCPHHIKATRP